LQGIPVCVNCLLIGVSVEEDRWNQLWRLKYLGNMTSLGLATASPVGGMVLLELAFLLQYLA
jgi:hypothetical protein